MSNLITAENLTFSYENGAFKLRDLNFTLALGESLAIIGKIGRAHV